MEKSEWLLRMERLYEKYGHIADPWVPDPEAWKYKKVSEDASAATGSGCAGIGHDVSSTGAATGLMRCEWSDSHMVSHTWNINFAQLSSSHQLFHPKSARC